MDGTSKGTRTVWVTRSDDDGATWARPVEITEDVKKPDWTWYATGPGVGIQLRSGRLVVPCDNKVAGSKVQQSHVIFSDDGGKTWKLGGVVGPQCNESQVVELRRRPADAEHPQLPRRTTAASSPSARTAARPSPEPVEDEALIEPVCQASTPALPRRRRGHPVLEPGQHEARADDGAAQPRRGQDVAATPGCCTTGRRRTRAWPCCRTGRSAACTSAANKSAYETITLARLSRSWLAGGTRDVRKRRILYNLDGDSCMFLKKGSKGPVPMSVDDLQAGCPRAHRARQPGRHAAGLHQRPGDVLPDEGRHHAGRRLHTPRNARAGRPARSSGRRMSAPCSTPASTLTPCCWPRRGAGGWRPC